ncbi:MAG TPA: hypothetical protein PKL76_20970 [Phycisphaerae bacterium]|nr:hypothetical protein [Phycisphaerae bacterium]
MEKPIKVIERPRLRGDTSRRILARVRRPVPPTPPAEPEQDQAEPEQAGQ